MSASSTSPTNQDPEPDDDPGPEWEYPGDDEDKGGFFSGLFLFEAPEAGWGNNPPQRGDDSSDF